MLPTGRCIQSVLAGSSQRRRPHLLRRNMATFEAIIGPLIEITFIATFTQRFFAR